MSRRISPIYDEAIAIQEAKEGAAQLTRPNQLLLMQREAFVEKLLLDNRPFEVIAQLASHQYGLGRFQVRRLINQIQARWEQEQQERRRYYKLSAIYRIHDTIAAARKEKNWSAVLKGEQLLMQIEGTAEPIQVSVEFNHRQAVSDYLNNLSDQDLQELAAEFSIDTEGETVG